MTNFTGKAYHFIGAGGVGMSGLAKVLLKNGAVISGSDQQSTAATDRLCELGAEIKVGHSEANIKEPLDAVVVSAAIKEDNAELICARRKGLKVYKYAEMLGKLMDGFDGIAVCGTHGKSTTGGWLAFVLNEAGVWPNYIIGADIPQLGGSSGVGDGQVRGYFLAEACEYDRSFLNLHPKIGVILNIEQDHLDYYADEAEIIEAFAEFAEGVREDGIILANGDDENVGEALSNPGPGREVWTFGFGIDCDYSARNVALVEGFYSFDVYQRDTFLGRARLAVAGRHNILNGLAVIAAGLAAGLGVNTVLELLGRFTGIDRRLMLKGRMGGVTILDDYAHHPTEIKASLEAARERFAPMRIWCVFQPHQYSRTRFLLDDFAESFKLADITIVPEIYFVRDTAQARTEISAEVLVERICEGGSDAVFINDFSGIVEHLKSNVRAGDLVVTMGAGDIWKVADEYIQWLGENS